MPPARKKLRKSNPKGRPKKGGAGDKGSETGLSSAEGDEGDKESNEGDSKSRGVGSCQPDFKDEPLTAIACRLKILKGFEEMTVLVDSYTSPRKIYFVNAKDCGSKSNVNSDCYKPVDKELYYSIFEVADARQPQITMENINRQTSIAMELFETRLTLLEYNFFEEKWEIDAARDRESMTNLTKKRKDLGHDSHDFKAMFDIFRKGDLCLAFVSGMNKGAGKAILNAMVEMALLAYFGIDHVTATEVACYSMGGGCDKSERLPLKETHPSFRNESRRSSWDSPIGNEMLTCAHGLAEGQMNRASTSSETSSTRYVKLDHKGVLADILAFSGCEPNWPHFLFVGEVKCAGEEHPGEFSDEAKAQLRREMLAALLHQSMVYGILMSDTLGYLSRMTLDFEKRIIEVSASSYHFVGSCIGIEPLKYSSQVNTWKHMFLDMVNALDDIKKNVKEVSHLPVKDPN